MKWERRFEYRGGGFERMLETFKELGWNVKLVNKGAEVRIHLVKGRAKGRGVWSRVEGVWTGNFAMGNRWFGDLPFDADDALRELSEELVVMAASDER